MRFSDGPVEVAMNKLAFVAFGVVMILAGSCQGDRASEPRTPAAPTARSVPVPTLALDIGRAKNEAINEAIRFAATGCPGAPLRLAGAPTRVLMALTSTPLAGRLISPETIIVGGGTRGPGFIGATNVWVIVIEGQSTARSTGDPADPGSGRHSFVFVVEPFDPTPTGCVIREAPMSTRFGDLAYGWFDFDVLLDIQQE